MLGKCTFWRSLRRPRKTQYQRLSIFRRRTKNNISPNKPMVANFQTSFQRTGPAHPAPAKTTAHFFSAQDSDQEALAMPPGFRHASPRAALLCLRLEKIYCFCLVLFAGVWFYAFCLRACCAVCAARAPISRGIFRCKRLSAQDQLPLGCGVAFTELLALTACLWWLDSTLVRFYCVFSRLKFIRNVMRYMIHGNITNAGRVPISWLGGGADGRTCSDVYILNLGDKPGE